MNSSLFALVGAVEDVDDASVQDDNPPTDPAPSFNIIDMFPNAEADNTRVVPLAADDDDDNSSVQSILNANHSTPLPVRLDEDGDFVDSVDDEYFDCMDPKVSAGRA